MFSYPTTHPAWRPNAFHPFTVSRCVLGDCIHGNYKEYLLQFINSIKWSVRILMTSLLIAAAEWGSVATSTQDECRFPSAWHGAWYESEVGQLTITATNISRKGHCMQRVDNYYLLENQWVTPSVIATSLLHVVMIDVIIIVFDWVRVHNIYFYLYC